MRIECKSTGTTTFCDYHSRKQHILPVLDKRSELNVFILFSQGTDRDIQIQNFRSKHGRFSSSLQISPFPMTIVQSLFSQKFPLWSLTLGPGQKSELSIREIQQQTGRQINKPPTTQTMPVENRENKKMPLNCIRNSFSADYDTDAGYTRLAMLCLESHRCRVSTGGKMVANSECLNFSGGVCSEHTVAPCGLLL